MRSFIHHSALRVRRGRGDRRSAIPEIAGNFDDLARTGDWVPFGTPEPEADGRVIGDEPPTGGLGWRAAVTVSPTAC